MDIVIVYEAHPAARLFPEPRQQDYDALKADIKANGQRFPIVVRGTRIIDGMTRLKICQELGVRPWIEQLPDGVDPWAYAFSCNFTRRHLTDDQRAMCAVNYAERVKKPTGAAAHKSKSDPTGVGVESKPNGQAADSPALAAAAKTFNVPVSKARKARALKNKDAAKAKAVHAGEVPLSKATRETKGKEKPKAKKEPKPGYLSRARRLSDAEQAFEKAKSEVEGLKEEVEAWREGMPDNLQSSGKAEALDECIGGLEDLLSNMENCDFSAIEFPGMMG